MLIGIRWSHRGQRLQLVTRWLMVIREAGDGVSSVRWCRAHVTASSSTRLSPDLLRRRLLLWRKGLREGEGRDALRLVDRRWRNTKWVRHVRDGDIGVTNVEDGGVIVRAERGRNVGIVKGGQGRRRLIKVRGQLLRVLRKLGRHTLTREVHQGGVHHVPGSEIQRGPALHPGHHHGLVPDEHFDLHVGLGNGK